MQPVRSQTGGPTGWTSNPLPNKVISISGSTRPGPARGTRSAFATGSFWNAPTLGWTYQLAYMLTHAAILADTKVRHYPLVETFDAWEDWDIIHSAPDRLRWGIWAYSHAAVKTPSGLKMPVGSYISWANQGNDLLERKRRPLSSPDNINAAVIDAQHRRTSSARLWCILARQCSGRLIMRLQITT